MHWAGTMKDRSGGSWPHDRVDPRPGTSKVRDLVL